MEDEKENVGAEATTQNTGTEQGTETKKNNDIHLVFIEKIDFYVIFYAQKYVIFRTVYI